MNHWDTNQIPYSWAPKDVVLKWSGMDHQTNYKNNPKKSDWEGVDITYNYNPQGFRCTDLNAFIGRKVNLALGCSFTEGVGLPIDCTWPALVGTCVEHPVLNLGIGSGSTDSVARILTNVSGLFDIQTVYILWPPLHRIERYMIVDKNHKLITNRVYKNGQVVEPAVKIYKIDTVYPMDSTPEHMWALTDEMSEQRLYQNQLIVNLLSQNFGYRVVQTTVDHVSSSVRAKDMAQSDFARDGVHWGIDTQKSIAKIMLDNQ